MMDSQKWLNIKVQVDVSADLTGRPVAYIYDISCKGNHLRPIAKCTRSRGSHPPADARRAPAASGRVGIPER